MNNKQKLEIIPKFEVTGVDVVQLSKRRKV
jgi:hypothetical protein